MTSPSNWRDEVVSLIPALRAFAWSLSHNGSDADDLVQDTLIKAWTNREKFEPGTNLRAWLFTILRNTYYTNVIRRRREVRDEQGEYASGLKAPATQDWSVAMRSAPGSRVHTPCGPRKSGMPESVEMPAPVRATTRATASIHSRTAEIRPSPSCHPVAVMSGMIDLGAAG